MKIYVGIKSENKTYYPLLIGYSSDGGFWISDLFLKQATAYITKVKIPANTVNVSRAPIDKNTEWISRLKPKITHHVNGNAHVSGTGVISGFYKLTGKAKGVQVNSMNLFRNDNDGGPIFVFSCWGLRDFGSGRTEKDLSVVFEENEIGAYPRSGMTHSDYVIEGFYIPRALENMINPITKVFLKPHPRFGTLPLKILPAPNNSPGFIGIACFEGNHGFQEESGFTLTGGPGQTNTQGYYENIVIIKPAIREFVHQRGLKSLDLHLQEIYRVFFKLDLLIANLVSKLKENSTTTLYRIRRSILRISPDKIALIRLKRLLAKRRINTSTLETIFRLVNRLLNNEDRAHYTALNFYATLIVGSPSKEVTGMIFRTLSMNLNTPLFRNPRREIEATVLSICSLSNLRSELNSFFNTYNLPVADANKLNQIESALRIIIKKSPLMTIDIPEALPGTNIRWFVVSPFSYMLTPFPSALYAVIGLFSSNAPLSLVVDGSIRERTFEEVPAYRHLPRN